MAKPISVQLYSLREESATDFPAVLDRVAAIGYKGVEPAGFYDMTPAGLRLSLHNHYWEYERIGDRLKIDLLAELCPEVLFEIDTYWAANFGAEDPVEVVGKYKDRAELLHLKDGPLVKGEPMVAVGSGKMDMPSVIGAADESVLRWLIVELDTCATDMFDAVDGSYRYLVGSGLATGNRAVD